MKEPVSAAVNEEVDGNQRAVRCSENLTPGGKRSPDSPLLIPMLFIYSINTNWALLHATTSRLQRCLNSGPCFLLVEGTEQVTDLVVRPGVGRDIILRDPGVGEWGWGFHLGGEMGEEMLEMGLEGWVGVHQADMRGVFSPDSSHLFTSMCVISETITRRTGVGSHGASEDPTDHSWLWPLRLLY